MKRKDGAEKTRAAAPPRARRTRLIVRRLPEETLVYDLESSRAHCLGPIAASVWRRCDGRSSAARIAAGVRKETGVRGRRGRGDGSPSTGWPARGCSTAPLPAGGRSRREWLKQAAMVAGLTVVSITAPLSVEAATCVANCDTRPQNPAGNCGAIPCCPPANGTLLPPGRRHRGAGAAFSAAARHD